MTHRNFPRNIAAMRYINLAGYIAIALAFGGHFFFLHGHHWEPVITFILAGIGVIPLARLMGESTEHLAERVGPTWGGLLNATFGNAAELIIAIIALSKGMNEVVKASLTGSIIGNLLLVGGAAMLAGGWKREKQTFNAQATEANAGLLAIGVAAMLLPAIFDFSARRLHDTARLQHEHGISIGTSVILLIVYALGLLFTLRTHAHLFTPDPSKKHKAAGSSASAHGDSLENNHGPAWSVKRSIVMLLLASAGIGIVAELLVGSAEAVAHQFGWNEVFVGVILLAIIGNAAEHSTAVMLARNDDMDTAMTITYQSSLQIALFATPFLVFVSMVIVALGFKDAHHLDLIFTPMEVVAVVLSVLIVIVLGMNGESNWFEGVLLLALYAILGITFFFLPATKGSEQVEDLYPTTGQSKLEFEHAAFGT